MPTSYYIDREGIVRAVSYGPPPAGTLEEQLAKNSLTPTRSWRQSPRNRLTNAATHMLSGSPLFGGSRPPTFRT